MPNWFPPPSISNGELSRALEPILAALVSDHPENILSRAPDVHPGGLALVQFVPGGGSVAPHVAARSVVSTELAPRAASGATRGLLWGLAVTLGTVWLEHQEDVLTGQTDYAGNVMPRNGVELSGKVGRTVAQVCGQASAGTATSPQVQPEILGVRAGTKTRKKRRQGDGKRWKIWARSRAGKRRFQL